MKKRNNNEFSQKGWPAINRNSWVALSDDLLQCLEKEKVKPVKQISEFTKTGVVLVDGEVVDLDRVIMSTGSVSSLVVTYLLLFERKGFSCKTI